MSQSIPFMDICVGHVITVLIIECGGKFLFVVQPYTPRLIELMEAMRYTKSISEGSKYV